MADNLDNFRYAIKMMCGDKAVLPTHRSWRIQTVIRPCNRNVRTPEPGTSSLHKKSVFNGHFINAKCGRPSWGDRRGNAIGGGQLEPEVN